MSPAKVLVRNRRSATSRSRSAGKEKQEGPGSAACRARWELQSIVGWLSQRGRNRFPEDTLLPTLGFRCAKSSRICPVAGLCSIHWRKRLSVGYTRAIGLHVCAQTVPYPVSVLCPKEFPMPRSMTTAAVFRCSVCRCLFWLCVFRQNGAHGKVSHRDLPQTCETKRRRPRSDQKNPGEPCRMQRNASRITSASKSAIRMSPSAAASAASRRAP